MDLKEAHEARERAWQKLYSNHHLSVLEWAELAEELDDIITELTDLHPEP